MPIFLRNVLAVLLLQPSRFVELHPRALRISSLASIMGWSWLSIFFEPQKVILFFLVGVLCIWTGPAACSRNYGANSAWRASFALAWCALAATGLSSILQSPLVDLVMGTYLFVGVKLQMRRTEPQGLTEIERCELRIARAALAGGVESSAFALSDQGAVYLREIGPAAAKWLDYDIPEYVVDVLGRRWDFAGTTSQGSSAPLRTGELLLPPGALYRPASF